LCVSNFPRVGRQIIRASSFISHHSCPFSANKKILSLQFPSTFDHEDLVDHSITEAIPDEHWTQRCQEAAYSNHFQQHPEEATEGGLAWHDRQGEAGIS
jgi:hypothetical protein